MLELAFYGLPTKCQNVDYYSPSPSPYVYCNGFCCDDRVCTICRNNNYVLIVSVCVCVLVLIHFRVKCLATGVCVFDEWNESIWSCFGDSWQNQIKRFAASHLTVRRVYYVTHAAYARSFFELMGIRRGDRNVIFQCRRNSSIQCAVSSLQSFVPFVPVSLFYISREYQMPFSASLHEKSWKIVHAQYTLTHTITFQNRLVFVSVLIFSLALCVRIIGEQSICARCSLTTEFGSAVLWMCSQMDGTMASVEHPCSRRHMY